MNWDHLNLLHRSVEKLLEESAEFTNSEVVEYPCLVRKLHC